MAVEYDHRVEFLIDNVWEDVTRIDDDTRVLGMDGTNAISVLRGRSGESADLIPPPTSIKLTFLDNNGLLNNDNPESPYYGKLTQNTQMRVIGGSSTDYSITETFTRSSASSWGTWPDVGDYTHAGSSGTAFTDFTISSNQGRMSVPVANNSRTAYVTALSAVEVESYAECTLPAVPAGGDMEPTLLLRGSYSGTFTYFMCRAVVAAGGAITARIISRVNSVETTLNSASTGLTFTTGAGALKLRAQVQDGVVSFKVWQGASEPAYQVTAVDDTIRQGGWLGLRSGLGAGNSNTKPVIFAWDNWTVSYRRILATGEIASFEPKWERSGSGHVITVPIEAAGIIRRLSQGDVALRSVTYRAYMSPVNDAQRVAYWPLEEESGATQIFSPTGASSSFISEIDFGGYTGNPGAERMITMGTGNITLEIPEYTSTEHRIAWYMTFPDSAPTPSGERLVMRVYCYGSNITHFDVIYSTDTVLAIKAWQGTTVLFNNSADYGSSILGNDWFMSVQLNVSGANMNVALYGVNLNDDTSTGGFVFATWTSADIGRMTRIVIGDKPTATTYDMTGISIGHVIVGNDTDAFQSYTNADSDGAVGSRAYRGERAANRISRLCREEGITCTILGQASDTPQMGNQTNKSVLALLKECVQADLGLLWEPRDTLGFRYRTRRDMYNQSPRAQIDYGSAHLSKPFLPVMDDNALVNTVIASRTGGSSYRYSVPSGDLDHKSPDAPPDGVNPYPGSLTLNLYSDATLDDVAEFYVHVRAWKEQRFPSVKIQLQRDELVADPALSQAISETEIGEVIQIDTSDAPKWVNVNPLLLRALGSSESLGRFQWDITFNTSSARPFEVGQIGYDDGIGLSDGDEDLRGARIDTDNTTLNEDLTTTETDVTVASASGYIWTLDSDDWNASLNGGGLYIEIGGEIMQVTNITGASSPQTFTVTRSINGIVKTHSTGAPVHVAYPSRIGM
jgi:hypothetical protein